MGAGGNIVLKQRFVLDTRGETTDVAPARQPNWSHRFYRCEVASVLVKTLSHRRDSLESWESTHTNHQLHLEDP